MHRLITALLCLSLASVAQSKSLISFEKGEVIPNLATTVEKTGHGQYKIKIPGKAGVPPPDKIRQQLQKELKTFAGLKITVQGDSIIINFQGPDTPLLQALARIDIEP